MLRFNPLSLAPLFAAAISLVGVSPAAGAVIVSTGNDPTFEVVQFGAAAGLPTGPASTIQGQTNSGILLDFISGDANQLEVQGQQVRADGGALFNFLTIQAQMNQSLTTLIFNLNVSEDATVTFSTAPLGITGTNTFSVNASGQNFFTITADPGEFSSLTMQLSNGGIQDIGQVRTGSQAVIPEPSTVVLLGSATLAVALRKLRRK